MAVEMPSEWITEKDRKWVEVYFPCLAFQGDSPLSLIGILKFDAIYDSEEGQFIVNPGERVDYHGERIQDSYEVEVIFKASEFSSLPQVYERGGRIDRVAQERRIKRVDLHINPNGAACLCLKTKEKEHLPNGFCLPDYIQNLVIPFFYEQSYYEKHSRWPWGEYSHGDLGYLEGYGENTASASVESVAECITLLKKYKKQWDKYRELLSTRKRKLKGHHLCFCGSALKIKKCHPKVMVGLWKLKTDIESLRLDARILSDSEA